MDRRATSAARALLALLGWIGLVVFLTWPLASLARTHLPASGSDTLYAIWALAWESHALALDPRRLLDGNIYHPIAHALAYGPTALGALLLFGPAFAASGDPVVATNVLLIGGSALTAWTTGLVTTRWTRSAAAGAVAGCAYLAAPWVLYEWAPRVPHYAMLMWLPLIVERAARPSLRLRDAVLLAVMIVLQSAVEIVYIAPAVFAPLAVIGALRICRRRTRVAGLYLAGVLVAAGIALLPLVAAHGSVRSANPQIEQQTVWPAKTNGMAQQTPVLPWDLFGWWQRAGNATMAPPPMALPPSAFALIACAAALLAVRGRRGSDQDRARAWRHAALWVAAGMLLSLPPQVEVWGAIVELPHGWLYRTLPAIRVLRVPMRLGVAGLTGLSLMTGLAFDEIVRALTTRRVLPRAGALRAALAAIVALVLLGQQRTLLGYPPGFRVPPLPREYPVIGRPVATPFQEALNAGDGPLLEIGAGVFSNPVGRAVRDAGAMFRSIGHWRPLLNGYSSYWPLQYARSMQLAAQLPEDPTALEALRGETGVELILVRQKELPAAKRAAWEAQARTPGTIPLALVASDPGAGALLFRVTERSAETAAP